MKKLILCSACVILLTACETPNYSSSNENDDFRYEVAEGKEVLTFNGYVLEVTEDNTIRVQVPKPGEMVEEGLQINEDGIIEVALASVQLPTDNVPFSNEINNTLKEMLVEQQISVKLPNQSGLESTNLEQLFGYINVIEDNKDLPIQSILIENGLAILDQNSPSIDSYLNELEKLQTSAHDNGLGLWAVDGLIKASNTAEGYLIDFAEYSEGQANDLLQQIKENNWDLNEFLKEYQ